jgi:hypothetical protein
MPFPGVPYTFEERTLAVTLILYEVPHPSIESSSETDSSDIKWVFFISLYLEWCSTTSIFPSKRGRSNNHSTGDYSLLMYAEVEGQTRAVYIKCMVNKIAWDRVFSEHFGFYLSVTKSVCYTHSSVIQRHGNEAITGRRSPENLVSCQQKTINGF